MRKKRMKNRNTLMFKGVKLLFWPVATYLLLHFKQYWVSYTNTAGTFVLLAATLYILYGFIKKTYNKAKSRKEYIRFLSSDIRYVDTLNGIEFERYLKAHFKRKGYRVFLTPPQHDYGVDLVIKKGKDTIAVQAKRYNHEQGYKVTYRAVQEVAAGKAYYNCNKGIVVTNSFFTKSAAELAKCNNIELWDRKRMIEEFRAIKSPRLYSCKNTSFQENINVSF